MFQKEVMFCMLAVVVGTQIQTVMKLHRATYIHAHVNAWNAGKILLSSADCKNKTKQNIEFQTRPFQDIILVSNSCYHTDHNTAPIYRDTLTQKTWQVDSFISKLASSAVMSLVIRDTDLYLEGASISQSIRIQKKIGIGAEQWVSKISESSRFLISC